MKRLIQTVDRLTQVLNAVANGITVQDLDGHLVFVNHAAAQMMHCQSPEEAIAKGGLEIISNFKFYDASGQPMEVGELPGRLALKGITEPEKIVGFAHKNDPHQTIKWTSIKAQPVVDEAGKVILAVNVLQDITATRHAERQLKEANRRVMRLLEQTLER